MDPLVGLPPRGGHPRVGQPVRPPQGPPVHATRGPTCRGDGVGRRLPRLWGFPRGDTWLPSFESWQLFIRATCPGGSTWPWWCSSLSPGGVVALPAAVSSGQPVRRRGRVRRGGRLVMADPHGPASRRITRWARDSVRGTRGTLSDVIRKRPTRGLLVADVLGNTVDTMTPLYTTIYNYSPRGVTLNLPSYSPSWFTGAPTKVPRPRGRADLGGAAPAAPRGSRRGHAGVVDGGSYPRRPRWSRGGGPRGRSDAPPTESSSSTCWGGMPTLSRAD